MAEPAQRENDPSEKMEKESNTKNLMGIEGSTTQIFLAFSSSY